MASNVVKSNRMRRMESRKSHSWWWDSHISPKNSKWLQENLEEMDQHVKRMLKLIEEDADSFAKKAEMYYQKRPELISLVEDFYRMYRSLAERYDHATGELQKNIPSDLQSQGSGILDVGSEPPSSLPSPDRRPARKSGPRAAGFDFFLGGGGTGSDAYSKEGDESSTLDSESESDDSSVNNYPGSHGSDEEQGLRRKIIELEVELREVKEKLVHVEDDENFEVSGKIAMYEEELQAAREKIRLSEEEINRLTAQLQKYRALETPDYMVRELQESTYGSDAEILAKIQTLEEELRITREKLKVSESKAASLSDELANQGLTIQNLQDQLKSSQKEVSTWKNKLEKEKREVAKLMDRVTRYKTNLTERDQEIRGLKEAMSNANKALSEENEQLQAEITRLTKERAYLMDNLKELDFVRQSLEEDVRRAKAGKTEAEAVYLAEIEQLKGDIAEKNENLEELKKTLEALEVKYENERDNLNIKIDALVVELSSRDDQIDEMNKHLHQLHMEHVELIKSAEELRGRIRELQREVERKEEIILEGAEEKREAIRQLCFSLEHYRNGYHKLREAVMGHKGMPVMAL